MIKNRSQKGFTLIETLVAISVLMIAIAGPLTVAAKAYAAAIDSKNRMVAYGLAQEGLEHLNNLKDNSNLLFWDHPDDAKAVFDACYDSNNPCIMNTVDGNTVPSGYTRTYYYNALNASYGIFEVTPIVTVTWKTGLLSDSVTLQEILTKYDR
jgi:prepilin-type N-terminal cleavage/methylation domain-containing protein